MRMLTTVLCLTLAGFLSATAMADEKPKEEKKGQAKGPTPTQRLLNGIELTAEQKEKVTAVNEEFQEQFAALMKQRTDILTAEQKKAQRDAGKAAREAGKTPAETRKAVQEALQLTEEQQEQTREVQRKLNELNVRIVAALKPLLTAEQIEKLPKSATSQNTGKGRKKKTEESTN